MNKHRKDSAEVIKFMTLFARLKLFCDDMPEDLADLAASDSGVADLCDQIIFAVYDLSESERQARVSFAAPVDPDFLAAWRDYEERYNSRVSSIWMAHLVPELGTSEPSRVPKADLHWDNADGDAEERAVGIETAIDWARSEVKNDILENEDFLEKLAEGVAAWDRLVADHGLDLRGVFRRRALVPFVLVPRKVAARHGSAEKLSMLKHLQQAHDAFVFGANYAAIALMRSIMETVLRDHYAARGKDLNEQIRNARSRLPRGANEAALHRLRKLANTILHLDQEKDSELPKMDEVRLEKEIVSLLLVIRALIEGAN